MMMDEDKTTTSLNVNAKPFEPQAAKPSTPPSASPNATPVPAERAPAFFLDAAGNYVDASGYVYFAAQPEAEYYHAQPEAECYQYYDGAVDELTARHLAYEDSLWANVYQQPQQPKGNTYGRARSQQRYAR